MKNFGAYFLLIFLIGLQGVAAQKRHISPEIFTTLKTDSYESCIAIADSLSLEYDSSPFLVGITNEAKLDGLAVIREFYIKAKEYVKDNEVALNRITDITIRMKVDTFLQLEKQYAKILEQADSLYFSQKYLQSRKLYERALSLKPADANVKGRLQELDELE